MLSRRGASRLICIPHVAPRRRRGGRQPFTRDAFAAAQAAGKSIIVHVLRPGARPAARRSRSSQKLEADPKFASVATFRVDFDSQKDALKTLKANRQSTIIVYKGQNEVGRSVGETNSKAIGDLLGKAL